MGFNLGFKGLVINTDQYWLMPIMLLLISIIYGCHKFWALNCSTVTWLSCTYNDTRIVADLWRDFWIRETGRGQQVAQLHDRYDDDDDDDVFFFLWRCDPTQVMASSFLMFLDHTQWHTAFGRTSLDEWSACRRDLYMTTHNTHNRQTSMSPVGFEPTTSAG